MITFNSYLKIKLLQGEHALPTMPLKLVYQIEDWDPNAMYMFSGLFFFLDMPSAKEVFEALQEPEAMDWLDKQQYDGFSLTYGVFDESDIAIPIESKVFYVL